MTLVRLLRRNGVREIGRGGAHWVPQLNLGSIWATQSHRAVEARQFVWRGGVDTLSCSRLRTTPTPSSPLRTVQARAPVRPPGLALVRNGRCIHPAARPTCLLALSSVLSARSVAPASRAAAAVVFPSSPAHARPDAACSGGTQGPTSVPELAESSPPADSASTMRLPSTGS